MKNGILLVDDEEHILAAMTEYFTGLGYAVDCAADARTAGELLDRHAYSVVITDLRLSRSDTFEGLSILEQARELVPRTSCIVLTAYGQVQNEARARERGADYFLQKPAPLHELAALVDVLVKRRSDEECRE